MLSGPKAVRQRRISEYLYGSRLIKPIDALLSRTRWHDDKERKISKRNVELNKLSLIQPLIKYNYVSYCSLHWLVLRKCFSWLETLCMTNGLFWSVEDEISHVFNNNIRTIFYQEFLARRPPKSTAIKMSGLTIRAEHAWGVYTWTCNVHCNSHVNKYTNLYLIARRSTCERFYYTVC